MSVPLVSSEIPGRYDELAGLRLAIGSVIFVLFLVGMVIYLRWKLPRDGEEFDTPDAPSEPPESTEDGSP